MIPRSPPIAGTVIRYRYLWAREFESGRRDGIKDRPTALLIATATDPPECIVLPITHSAPGPDTAAIEMPRTEAVRLGLDGERSWIVLDETNSFLWPGPDLGPVPGRKPRTVVYGMLSRPFFGRVLAAVQSLLRECRLKSVDRD